MEQTTCGSRAEVAEWGHSILLIIEGARASTNFICSPAPGWALLSYLQPPGSFLSTHRVRETPQSPAHTNPSLQGQSIQVFSPARPDLCLIRAAQSQEVFNQAGFQRNPLECFVSEQKLEGASGLFHSTRPHSIYQAFCV